MQQPGEALTIGLVDRNQGNHGPEGHLKADAGEASRIDRQYDCGGDSANTHGNSQPVDQDRSEDDAGHDKGALGRNRGTRD